MDLADLDGANGDDATVKTCHICHATCSSIRTNYCTSCGHPLCHTCECPVPKGAKEAHEAFDESGGAHRITRDGETLSSYNSSQPSSASSLSAPAGVGTSQHHVTTQERDIDESSRDGISAVTSPSRSGASVSSSVKDNPFIVADRLAAGKPSTLKRHNESQASRRGVVPSQCVSHRSDGKRIDEGYRAPAGRETHPGHQNYADSVNYRETRPTRGLHEPFTETRQQAEPHSSRRERHGHEMSRPLHGDRDSHDVSRDERQHHRARDPIEQRHHHKREDHSLDRPQLRPNDTPRGEAHERGHKRPRDRSSDHGPSLRESRRGEHEHHSRERSRPRTREVQRGESHERSHKHPRDHTSDNGPSLREYRRREHREGVRPLEIRPRSRTRSPPGRLHGRQDHHKISSDKLNDNYNETSDPDRSEGSSSPEQAMIHGSSQRPSGPPPQYEPEETPEEEDFGEMQGELDTDNAETSRRSYPSQLPKETKASRAHREAERGLRKIRSEAQILSSTVSKPKETTLHHGASSRHSKRSGLTVPTSVTSLPGESSLGRPKLSAKDKGKGRDIVHAVDKSESRRHRSRHRHATEGGSGHRLDWTPEYEEPRMTSRDKGKAKGAIYEPSDVPHSSRTPTQQHAVRFRRPASGCGCRSQCDWKDRYETLKAEIEDGLRGQGSGVFKAGLDHECAWKDKYDGLKAGVECGDQCVWKDRYLALRDDQGQEADLGLEGLTIALHLRGKDDVVINTDLRDLDQQ